MFFAQISYSSNADFYFVYNTLCIHWQTHELGNFHLLVFLQVTFITLEKQNPALFVFIINFVRLQTTIVETRPGDLVMPDPIG